MSHDEDGAIYVALFNLSEKPSTVKVQLEDIGCEGTFRVRSLWEQKALGETDVEVSAELLPHGAALYRLEKA